MAFIPISGGISLVTHRNQSRISKAMVTAPKVLLSLDRLRKLTPRELTHVLLFACMDGDEDYAHAVIALFVPPEVR